MDDWLWATAAQLGRGIEAGEIDPVALARVYLEAAEAHPLGARIYARMTPERALAEAEAAAARARLGLRRGPLDGVPVSWKDLFDTAGTATEAGTLLMAGRIPTQDAEVLRNATGNGLVCLGKTHLSEIAFSGLGVNPVTATAPNVHDPGAAPGGSSSGAAASLAHGLAAGAYGSDTGGSCRIPAAWNDLVGFKTTHGRHPLTGVVALAETLDTIGPLARSVEDAALLDAALGAPATDLRGVQIEGARLLIVDTIFMEDLAPEPAAAFADAERRLTAAGARVSRAEWEPLREAFDLMGPLQTADAWSAWEPLVKAHGDKMFARIRDRVSTGADISAATFLQTSRRLNAMREMWEAFIAPYDAVLSPATPNLPAQTQDLIDDPDLYVRENLAALRNTRIGNMMGGTSISLPTGAPSCGLMLTAGAGRDGALLRLAHAVERALA